MIGLLFDLEGTLIKSGYQKNINLLNDLHETTKKKILNYGIPKHILKDINTSVLSRNKSYEYIIDINNEDELNKFRTYVETFMIEYDMLSASQCELYPHTLKILEYLKNKEYQMAIVTNTSKMATMKMLSLFDILKYFSVIITRNDVLKLKPEPNMILKALSQMSTIDNYFIGDSRVDVIAAKKAQIKSILIIREKKYPKYNPDIIIKKLTDLKRFF